MNRVTSVTLAPAAAVANNIATAQTVGAPGNLVLNGALVAGGVATMDVPRRVGITAVSDETAKTFTVYGTDRNDRVISEAIAGPGAGATVESSPLIRCTWTGNMGLFAAMDRSMGMQYLSK